MATLASLVVEISANTAKWQAGMKQAQDEARRGAAGIQRALGGIQRDFTALTSTVQRFASVLGVAVGIGGITAMARQTLAFADNLDEMSQRLGINVERLQVLQFAANQTGVSVEQLERGIRTLADTIGDAARGEETAVKKFQDLGVSIEGTAGHVASFETILGRVADRIAASRSPIEQINLANKAFGDRVGTFLLPILQRGAKGFEEWATAAREAGVIVSAEMIQQAGKAKDQLDALSKAILANLVPAIVAVSPLIISMAKGLSDAAAAAGRFFGTFAPDSVVGLDELNRRIEAGEANLSGLRKQLSELGGGGLWKGITEGPFKESNLLKQVREQEEALARLRTARDAAQQKQKGGVDVPMQVIGTGAKDLKVIEGLQRKLQDLGTENEFSKEVLNIQRALEAARKEAPGLAKEIDRLGVAMLETAAARAAFEQAAKDRTAAVEAEGRVEEQSLQDQVEARDAYNRQVLAEYAEEEAALEALQKQHVETAQIAIDALEEEQRALANLPKSAAQQFREELALIGKQAEVLGPTFDEIGARANAIRQEMVRLLGLPGVSTTSEAVKDLAAQLDELNQIQLAQGGIRDFFGALDQALTQSIAGVIQGTQTIEQAFEKMGQSIALSLIQNVIRRGIHEVEKAVISLVTELMSRGLWQFVQPGAATQASAAPTMVSPTTFAEFAYQGGGLAKSPQVATLAERGPEYVIPASHMDQWGGGDTSIVINNYTDSRVSARQRETPDGRQIQIMVENMVEQGISSGRYDGAARGAWGVTRAPMRR